MDCFHLIGTAKGGGRSASENIAQLALLIFLLPWFLVWLDASDDYERDSYLNHDPIYAELKDETRKEREKRGY